jgi:hypothetical protein
MRLPQSSAGYGQRVRFGRYVAARLKKAKLAEQVTAVETVTSKVNPTSTKKEVSLF